MEILSLLVFGILQSSFITAEQLVFTRVKHASCWSRDKHPDPCYPHLPNTTKRIRRETRSTHHISLVHDTFHCFLLFILLFIYRSAFLAFLSFPLSCFLSLDPLMSAHTCCHIPPVQFSVELDRTGLNWASLKNDWEDKDWNLTIREFRIGHSQMLFIL